MRLTFHSFLRSHMESISLAWPFRLTESTIWMTAASFLPREKVSLHRAFSLRRLLLSSLFRSASVVTPIAWQRAPFSKAYLWDAPFHTLAWPCSEHSPYLSLSPAVASVSFVFVFYPIMRSVSFRWIPLSEQAQSHLSSWSSGKEGLGLPIRQQVETKKRKALIIDQKRIRRSLRFTWWQDRIKIPLLPVDMEGEYAPLGRLNHDWAIGAPLGSLYHSSSFKTRQGEGQSVNPYKEGMESSEVNWNAFKSTWSE